MIVLSSFAVVSSFSLAADVLRRGDTGNRHRRVLRRTRRDASSSSEPPFSSLLFPLLLCVLPALLTITFINEAGQSNNHIDVVSKLLRSGRISELNWDRVRVERIRGAALLHQSIAVVRLSSISVRSHQLSS